MRSQLLHAESNTLLLVIKVQNNHVEFLVEFKQLFWMVDAAPRHIGDVHQSVDASQIHKHTV